MKQYYSAEHTANPIWLLQVKGLMGVWETKEVFSNRELAEVILRTKPHHFPPHKSRVYAISISYDNDLAMAMREIRTDLPN